VLGANFEALFQFRSIDHRQDIRLNRQETDGRWHRSAEFTGTIVGLSFDVWVPLTMEPALSRAGMAERANLSALASNGAVEAGVSLSEAQAEVQIIRAAAGENLPEQQRRNWRRSAADSPAPYGAQSRWELCFAFCSELAESCC
jgi:hypothetical protein